MTNKSLLAMVKMTIMTVIASLQALQKQIEDELHEST